MTMQRTQLHQSLPGLLAGLIPGQLQAWGLLEVIPLFAAEARPDYAQFVSPLANLKLVSVPRYGSLVLQNESKQGTLIVPMHIAFFQTGAQNHATSRAVLLKAGETLTLEDCFCIQASQGGLLQEAQQRFIILPLSLRKAALNQQQTQDFSRLWTGIDAFNRRYGIARGGHLERFLRPYFHRLMRFRHAFEVLPGQVGAVYFVAGNLVGVEVGPNTAYWADIGPILTIYCYGAAALLAERQHLKTQRQVVDLEGLVDLDDLVRRLAETRQEETAARHALINALSMLDWNYSVNVKKTGLRIVDIEQGEWSGQMAVDEQDTPYLSVFRDIVG